MTWTMVIANCYLISGNELSDMADLPYDAVLKIVKKNCADQIDDAAVYAIIRKTEEYIAIWTREGVRLASHAGRKTIKAEDLQLATAVAPIVKPSDIQNILRGEYGDFPLYGIFLYSSLDKDISDFVSSEGSWIHSISGNDCLLMLFENPENWKTLWKGYWQEKLGSKFDEKMDEWRTLLPEHRDLVYSVADNLNIRKNTLPCIVFINSFHESQILCVPIIDNKDRYKKYFEDLFDLISSIKDKPPEERFDEFQKKWKSLWGLWGKYILPQKIRAFNAFLQEWGSLIIETKTTIINIIEPITPLIVPIRGIIH
jgi:histone H3/H4